MKNCSIDGCCKPLRAHGLCNMHYERQRRAIVKQGRPHRPREATDIMFSLRLSEHEHRQLVSISTQRNCTLSDTLRQLIREEAEQ